MVCYKNVTMSKQNVTSRVFFHMFFYAGCKPKIFMLFTFYRNIINN